MVAVPLCPGFLSLSRLLLDAGGRRHRPSLLLRRLGAHEAEQVVVDVGLSLGPGLKVQSRQVFRVSGRFRPSGGWFPLSREPAAQREADRLGADGRVDSSVPDELLERGDVPLGLGPVVRRGAVMGDDSGEDVQAHARKTFRLVGLLGSREC